MHLVSYSCLLIALLISVPSLSVCALSGELVARDVLLQRELDALTIKYEGQTSETEEFSKKILIHAKHYSSLVDITTRRQEASRAWQMFLKLPDENQSMILKELEKITARAENNMDEEFEKLNWWLKKDLGWRRLPLFSRDTWSALSIEDKIKKTRTVIDGKPEEGARQLWPLLKAEMQLASCQEFLCLLDQGQESEKLRKELDVKDQAEQPSVTEAYLRKRVVGSGPDDKSSPLTNKEKSSEAVPSSALLQKPNKHTPAPEPSATQTTSGKTAWIGSDSDVFHGLFKIYFWSIVLDKPTTNNWLISHTNALSARLNMSAMTQWTLTSGTLKPAAVDLYIFIGAFVFSWTDPMNYWDHIFRLENQINALRSARQPLFGLVTGEEFQDISILQKLAELNAFRMLAVLRY